MRLLPRLSTISTEQIRQAPNGERAFTIAKRWDAYAHAFGNIKDGVAFFGFNFLVIYLQSDFFKSVIPFCLPPSQFALAIGFFILCSSGIGGGTGSPEIFVTALNLQLSKQVPHLTHLDWSIMWIFPTAPSIALVGQLRAHSVQAMHFAGSI